MLLIADGEREARVGSSDPETVCFAASCAAISLLTALALLGLGHTEGASTLPP